MLMARQMLVISPAQGCIDRRLDNRGECSEVGLSLTLVTSQPARDGSEKKKTVSGISIGIEFPAGLVAMVTCPGRPATSFRFAMAAGQN